MTTLALWTFIFLYNPATGRTVTNLTEPACKQLKVDVARVFGYPGADPGRYGMCVPQAKWAN